MASRPPQRFVVRPLDATANRRQQIWLVAAWVASLLVVAGLAWLIAGHGTPRAMDRSQLRKLTAQNDDLLQQVANLQRSEQVSHIAANELKGTLREREEEISGLRTDLAFYSRLIAGSAQREGLSVQDARVEPVAGSTAWNFIITLTQNAQRGAEIKGMANVSVEGIRGDKVVVVEWTQLGSNPPSNGLNFTFKYFQVLRGTLVLPADFKPARLRINVTADGGETDSRTVDWTDASKPAGDNHVQK
jgi:hypothetical protein